MKKKRFIFFHGGPGFNALAESAILEEEFCRRGAEILFWREPLSSNDSYDSQNAFENLLASAKSFLLEHSKDSTVEIIAHSFAIHTVSYLASVLPKCISKITVLAPAIDLTQVDQNIFTQSIINFKKSDQLEVGKELQELVNKSKLSDYCENRKKAITMTFDDQNLFPLYWHNKDMMVTYAKYFFSDGVGLDARALLATKESMGNKAKSYPISPIPVYAIFGQHDFLIDIDSELRLLKEQFVSVTHFVFEHSAHYPHLEEIEHFLESIF